MKIQARAKALRGMRPGMCLGDNKSGGKISCPEFSFGVSSYLDLEVKQMEKKRESLPIMQPVNVH